MERDSSQSNTNFNLQDENSNSLLESYMSFVSSSNSAVGMVLDILHNQQLAFNQIISVNRPHNINFASSFPTDQPLRSHSIPIFSQNGHPSTRVYRNPLPTAVFPNRPNIALYFDHMQSNTANIPTDNELAPAIVYITFSEIEEPLNVSCPISHRDFSANDTVIQLRECRHIFDASSILQWFTRNSLCPLCRNDIRTVTEDEINTPTSTPLPFAEQLATLISEQLSNDRDFSGNMTIDLAIPGPSVIDEQ
jgi:hypothetical protein